MKRMTAHECETTRDVFTELLCATLPEHLCFEWIHRWNNAVAYEHSEFYPDGSGKHGEPGQRQYLERAI